MDPLALSPARERRGADTPLKSIPRNLAPVALLSAIVLAMAAAAGVTAGQAPRAAAPGEAQDHPGFRMLIENAYSSPLMTIDQFGRLWTVWEPPQRARAERAAPAERRRMAFERYGLIDRPFDETGLPLGYTDDGQGNLVTNCFSCHGGKVAGRTIPGVANTHQDLTSLATDLVALRAADRGQPAPATGGAGPLGIPLNFTRGFSNATMFSLVLGALRDRDLNPIFPPRPPGPLTHNDMDAPPWWNFKKKEKIYCDAFAPPSTRTLMQFTLSPFLTGAKIRSWEPDFEIIRDYIAGVEPPPYPYEIDAAMAARGEDLFNQTCARCHGTYGPGGEYPNKVIPLAEVGTDPARLRAVPRASREFYNQSWFSDYGERPVNLESRGYLAQPLDGIWASAPYLHNGSVPTIWHLFHPERRPKVWKRDENGYDREKLGLVIETLDATPDGLSARERRMYYDTATPSHGAGGHLFPDRELTAAEKRWVMEYLKTL